MSCWVKADRCTADFAAFAKADRLDLDFPEPVPHDGGSALGCEIVTVPGPRVIGVAMCDQRPVDGLPRVDEEISGGAVDPAVGKSEQLFGHDPRRVTFRALMNTPCRGILSARAFAVDMAFDTGSALKKETG